MCRSGGRRCRGASTSKAAAARRARSYRARKAGADPNAATGNQPTSEQETAVPQVPEVPADRPPAGGDVTHTGDQPAETSTPKPASKPKREKLTKSQKLMKQVHANLEAEYGKPMTAQEQAAVEEAAAAARQAQDDHNAAQVAAQRAEDAQALRERQQPAREPGIGRERRSGPVNVVGDGNITIAHGGDVTRAKRPTSPRTSRGAGRHIVEDHTGDTPASDEDHVWTVSSTPVPDSHAIAGDVTPTPATSTAASRRTVRAT